MRSLNITWTEIDPNELRDRLGRLRGNPETIPDASIIIPVNAQGDLRTVLKILADISRYTGKQAIEIILVINNYPPGNPPVEVDQFRSLGAQVVATSSARRPGEVVIMSARALGARAAKSEVTIHFDADCRIPDIDALLDWYIRSMSFGAQLAYSQVGFYELPKPAAIRVKLAIHYTTRWLKRNFLGIPTTRGSNYAINRSLFLQIYDAGRLSVDIQVGPAAKLAGAQVVYSGRSNLRVFTSARRERGRWIRLLPYFLHRLRYNLKVIPTRWREVTRTSWQGFDEETNQRQQMEVPKADRDGADSHPP